jgi:hypothetical protein
MTDREVIEYLERNKDGCGRFRKDQLETKMTLSQLESGTFRWRTFLLGFLSFVAAKGISAHPLSQSLESHKASILTDTSSVSSKRDSIRITGQIIDNSTHKPIQGASARIKTDNFHIYAMSQSNGRFALSFARADFDTDTVKLSIQCLGYAKVSVVLSAQANQKVNVGLKPESFDIEEVVVSGQYKVSPSQKIKYWFRRTFHIYPKHVKGKIKL